MRTITVKQAKPSEQDFDCVHDFLQGLEAILEEGCLPDADDEGDKPGEDATPEVVMTWIETQWWKKAVSLSWSRVLWAGKCAIDNCCDPKADVLEWRPEVLELLAAAKGMERYASGRLCAAVKAMEAMNS